MADDGERAKGLRAMREKKHKGASISVAGLFGPRVATKTVKAGEDIERGDAVVIKRGKAKKAKRK